MAGWCQWPNFCGESHVDVMISGFLFQGGSRSGILANQIWRRPEDRTGRRSEVEESTLGVMMRVGQTIYVRADSRDIKNGQISNKRRRCWDCGAAK